jgi:hypothetical protein
MDDRIPVMICIINAMEKGNLSKYIAQSSPFLLVLCLPFPVMGCKNDIVYPT